MAQLQAAKLVLANRRSGTLLSYRGYLYAKNRSRADKMYWRCSDKTCGVFVHTNIVPNVPGSSVNILKEPTLHQHPPCDASIERREMVRQMIHVVQADPCAPVRAAYDYITAGTNQTHDLLDDAVPSFDSVATVLRRKRSVCFPPVPRNIANVAIDGEWAKTWADRPHLSFLDNNWGIVVFMTNQNARALAQCENVFIDGTFRTAPYPFVQMVTIHGFYREIVIPMCFCLLSDKTIAQYRQVLSHVAAKVRANSRRPWRPTNVICDFEIAMITSLQTELPHTRIRGCYFHFTQSLWRKVAALGLVTQYRSNSTRGRRLRKLVQKVMAIGFLPGLLISTAFRVKS